MSQTKQRLRHYFRQRRQQLSANTRHDAAITLRKNILAALPDDAHHIGVYLSHDHEIDLTPIITELWQQHRSLYLPIIHPLLKRTLWFCRYRPTSTLVKNHYHIDEPLFNAAHIIAPWELDIALVPLVAFNAQGDRLGMGGGYYDNSFRFIHHNQSDKTRPLMWGCAYHLQESHDFLNEVHDLNMDLILTNQK